MILRLPIFIFMACLAALGCQSSSFFDSFFTQKDQNNSSTMSVEATKQPLIDLVTHTAKPLNEIKQYIISKYPPNQYHYIFVGRSPTPLFALMGLEKNTHAVPFSNARGLPLTTFDLNASCGHPFWLKKMFDHFDLYLIRLIQQLKASSGSKKILVIDFVAMGESIGIFLKFLNHYLRYHAFISGIGPMRIPSTEYFAISNTDYPYNLSRIRERIAEWNTPMTPSYVEKLPLKVVVPGAIRANENVVINGRKWTEMLNNDFQKSWEGTILSISDKYLLEALSKEKFDSYAPYGSWKLQVDPLEKSPLPLRKEFWDLRHALLSQ